GEYGTQSLVRQRHTSARRRWQAACSEGPSAAGGGRRIARPTLPAPSTATRLAERRMGLQVLLRLPDARVQGLRYALRPLRKARGSTVTSALTLALGIGANSAIFGIVGGVLIRPLPYEDPSRVVRLLPQHGQYGESDGTFS